MFFNLAEEDWITITSYNWSSAVAKFSQEDSPSLCACPLSHGRPTELFQRSPLRSLLIQSRSATSPPFAQTLVSRQNFKRSFSVLSFSCHNIVPFATTTVCPCGRFHKGNSSFLKLILSYLIYCYSWFICRYRSAGFIKFTARNRTPTGLHRTDESKSMTLTQLL